MMDHVDAADVDVIGKEAANAASSSGDLCRRLSHIRHQRHQRTNGGRFESEEIAFAAVSAAAVETRFAALVQAVDSVQKLRRLICGGVVVAAVFVIAIVNPLEQE